MPLQFFFIFTTYLYFMERKKLKTCEQQLASAYAALENPS